MSYQSSEQQQRKQSRNVLKGPAVKQFQWFQMQTRVRKIIQQIIDPVQSDIIKNHIQIQDLQQNDSKLNNQIREILRMTTNDPQIFNTGLFIRIQQKFQSQQKVLTYLQNQVKNNTQFINEKINLIDLRMQQSNDMMTQVQELKISNHNNLKQQTQKFNIIRRNQQQNITRLTYSIEHNQLLTRDKIQNIQKNVALSEIKMERMTKEFGIAQQLLKDQKLFNDNMIQTGIQNQQDIKNLTNKLNESILKIKQLNGIKSYLKDMQTQYKKFIFKVDNIVPLINQAQINECLYKILPSKYQPRIAVYQFQKYMSLNQCVLNRHFETQPLSLQFNGQQTIRHSQQRNTKLLTRLKRSYYKNIGVDLDFISFQERQRLLNDFDYSKLTEIVDQLEGLDNQHITHKKGAKITQQDVNTIVSNMFNQERESMKIKFNLEINDSKVFIQDLQTQFRKTMDHIQNKIDKFITKSTQVEVSDKLQFQNIQQKLKNQQISNNVFNTNFQALKTMNLDLVKFFEIQNQKSKNKNNIQKFSYMQKKKTLGIMAMNDDINDKRLQAHDDINLYDLIQQNQKIIKRMKNSTSVISTSNLQKPQLLNQINIGSKQPSIVNFYNSQASSQMSNYEPLNSKISLQMRLNPQKDGFLKIPIFENENGLHKVHRQSSFSTRLQHRRHSILLPSKSSFQVIQRSSQFKQGYDSNHMNNSVSCFNSLKKQNKRYLK